MSFRVGAAVLVCLAGLAGQARGQAAADSASHVAAMEAKLADWPQLARYREANAALPPVAAPVPPACGDVTTLPTRDKLAQLLMVGVKNADDARAVARRDERETSRFRCHGDLLLRDDSIRERRPKRTGDIVSQRGLAAQRGRNKRRSSR